MKTFHGVYNGLILITLFLCTAFGSEAQRHSFRASSPAVERTMHQAVANAERFITFTIPRDVYSAHFSFIASLSWVRSDYASYHYTPSLTDTISFTPGRYELRYLIKIEGDTLTDSFTIPVDSLGNVDVDTSNFHYIFDDLKAYKKLLTGQYKFDFRYVREFIKDRGLKDYSVVFMNSSSTLNSKNYKTLKVFKHYWYVMEYRGTYKATYTIDPDTGKAVLKKEKIRRRLIMPSFPAESPRAEGLVRQPGTRRLLLLPFPSFRTFHF